MYDPLLAIVMTVIVRIVQSIALYIVQSYIIRNYFVRTYVYSDAGVFMTLSRTKELQ